MRVIAAAMVWLGMLIGALPAHAGTHPHLGDSKAAWIQDWGAPTHHVSVGVWSWKRCAPPSARDHILAEFVFNQATDVGSAVCDASKKQSLAARFAEALLFFPHDYKSMGTVRTTRGIDQQYYSAALAKTTAGKSRNIDCALNSVKPGLFTYSPDDGFGRWTLQIGTCA